MKQIASFVVIVSMFLTGVSSQAGVHHLTKIHIKKKTKLHKRHTHHKAHRKLRGRWTKRKELTQIPSSLDSVYDSSLAQQLARVEKSRVIGTYRSSNNEYLYLVTTASVSVFKRSDLHFKKYKVYHFQSQILGDRSRGILKAAVSPNGEFFALAWHRRSPVTGQQVIEVESFKTEEEILVGSGQQVTLHQIQTLAITDQGKVLI